ncbi:MAG: type II secretion system F family protein [Pirellulales bacterium]|nr:type II secretion system F family protein [Pirellulales bacterium]
MTYQYRARDSFGSVLGGSVEAATPEEAAALLRRDGLHVLEIEEADGDEGLFPKRITKSDLIYVTSQLAIMVDTGITLSQALGGIVEQETNPTLRRVLSDLKESVEGGQDFSAALARHPRYFDNTYVSLVKASEVTGTLGPMLERIAGYLRKEAETRGKVRAAMAYPTVMMALACGVTIFLLTYILPKFMPLFKSKGTELPRPTLIMMAVSDALLGYWWLWLIAAVAALVGFLYGRRTAPGRKAVDWIKINAPIVGPMYRKVTISRGIRTLGTMLASGVPVMEAIRLAGAVSSNFFYERLWTRVHDEVAGGKRICEILRGDPLFPNVLVQMIAAGEDTGRLDDVLEKVSTYYDREVETSLKATTSLIEPIMIAVMGVVVGTIGMALMLPIFSLSKQP